MSDMENVGMITKFGNFAYVLYVDKKDAYHCIALSTKFEESFRTAITSDHIMVWV